MKEVDEILKQKEAELADVRKQIESLHIVAPLLSNEPTTENAFDILE